MTRHAELLERVRQLHVWRRGARRAPHKPLLLLHTIGRLLNGDRKLPFESVEQPLKELLREYAPPVKSRHQPELPYWHLQSDGLWVVEDAESLPKRADNFPSMSLLRGTVGHLDEEFATALTTDASFLRQVVSELLHTHFTESLHDEILGATGLADRLADTRWPEVSTRRRRDPRFRADVLRAYEHRCAVTGFRAALGGRYFGCEAAHIQWHGHDGPDRVSNGLALEPTMHTLLDKGAWTLSDKRVVLVSAEFTGSDAAVARLRSFHGQALSDPLPGYDPIGVEYIRWHREPDQGGVFRSPALAHRGA